MKHIIVFLLLGLAVLSGGCQKSKTQSTGLQMSAAINSLQWFSYSSTVAIQKTPNIQGTGVVITADSAKSRFKLTIGNYHGAGAYDVSDSVNGAVYYDFNAPPGSQEFKGSSGEIIVTANTPSDNSGTNIKGTFHFLTPGPSISSGIFNVTLDLN
jgi:hypothetical protein